MAITSKERAELRAEAHHLKALVHIGQHGITDTVRQTLDDVLRTHELVKIQFVKDADEAPKAIVNGIADQMRADVVQVIGRTATLYRHNAELKRKKGALPPWR